MAFKEVGGVKVYRPWNQWAAGDKIVGVYCDSYTDNYGKPGYGIEIESCAFEDQDAQLTPGQVIGLNNCGGLAFRFSQCHPGTETKIIQFGTRVEIIYMGMDKVSNKKSQFFGEDSHQVKVGVDEEVLYANRPLDAKKIKEVQDSAQDAGELSPDDLSAFKGD